MVCELPVPGYNLPNSPDPWQYTRQFHEVAFFKRSASYITGKNEPII
jgi:hypothetical protein